MRRAAPAAVTLALLAGCGGEAASERPVAAATATATVPTPAPGPSPPPPEPRRTEEGVLPRGPLAVRVTEEIVLRDLPNGSPIITLGPKTEFGSDRYLAVAEQRGEWLGLRASELRNGRIGWVRRAGLKLLQEPKTITVDLSERLLTVRTRGKVTGRHVVGIGSRSTPTPVGRFAVTDRLTVDPGSPYGCCVLALTGHQPNIAQGWGGGDRLAIHGTTVPASVGRPGSRGCLRASEASMRRLLREIPLGAPVTIRR